MDKSIFRLVVRLLPIAYMIIIWLQSSHFDPESIYTLSSRVNEGILYIFGAGFELFHLFQFGILYFLLVVAYLSFGKLNNQIETILLIVSLTYGMIDEMHQMFVPFRSFSFIDLFKDSIGVFVASYFIHKSYFREKDSRLGMLLGEIESIFKKKNENIPF